MSPTENLTALLSGLTLYALSRVLKSQTLLYLHGIHPKWWRFLPV